MVEKNFLCQHSEKVLPGRWSSGMLIQCRHHPQLPVPSHKPQVYLRSVSMARAISGHRLQPEVVDAPRMWETHQTVQKYLHPQLQLACD